MAETPRPQVNLRSVALPAEHGGWGFLIEPVLLGLLVASSLAGVCLGMAVFGGFLVRQPLKIALLDRRRQKRYARTTYAERFVLLYGSSALAGLIAAVLLADTRILLPLIAALPAFLAQIVYDARSDSRALLPELAGPLALGAVASSIALAGGWTVTAASMLWVIIAGRAVPSVLYVRARLRLEKSKPANPWWAIITSAGSVIVLGLLALGGFVPWLTVVAMLILLVRAARGLSSYRRPIPARVIGFQEMAFGLITIILAAAGYAWGW
jgi:hypothetical protein